MNFHALKEGGNQNPGMETENQVKTGEVLVRITLLMTGILQLTENVLLHSRAWTWPHCHHVNVPGMMDQGPLTTEKWMLQVGLQKRGAKEQRVFLEHNIQIFTLASCNPLLYCPYQNQLGFGSLLMQLENC
uniref:Uncharacterized protein n=1 Tax=Amazona collaria TaxID=241587 RepID=A0A8B9FM89_9PSIT